MESNFLAQVFVNSIMLGALYSMIAIGLALIFGVMRVVQFAHGQLYMLGAFAVFYLTGYGQNYYLTLVIAAIIGAILGLLLERGFFRRVRGQPLPSMIVGVGLLLLIEAVALLAFGEVQKYMASPLPGAVQIGEVSIAKIRIVILGISCALVMFLFLFLRKVKMGRAMRAVAQDEDAALLQGVNINRTNAIGFAVGSALAAVAGGLVLPIAVATPFIGDDVIMKAFIMIIIGGMGSITGAVVGAFIFGFVESFGYSFLGTGAPLIAFVIVILVLIFRPQGVLGRE